MSRYIDFEIAREYLHKACECVGGNGGLMLKIKFDQEPKADVVEKEKWDRLLENSIILADAVQKYQLADVQEVVHGEWKLNNLFGFKIYDCSNCGIHMETRWNYCPHCGAKMEVTE